MTSPLVVDASVSAAWFLPDEANAYTEAMLEATAQTDVWVPALWPLEMANLLLSAYRRNRIAELKRRQLAADADLLRVRVDREPVSIGALDALAGRFGLTAYDAVYLELAMRRRLPLATQDRALRKAMTGAGVSLADGAA